MSKKLPLRNELPVELTWDLSLLFKNQDEFEKAVADLKNGVTHFNENYCNKINSLEILKQAVLDLNEISEQISHIMNYGSLGYSVDRTNEQNEANVILIQNLSEWVGKRLAFFRPELAQLDNEIFAVFEQEESMTPFIPLMKEIQRAQAHILSADQEALLSSLNMTLNGQENLYGTIKFEDLEFEDFEVDGTIYHNSFAGFEQDYEPDSNIEVRHQAWESFHKGLAKFQNTAGQNYIQKVQFEKKMATLRGYDSVFDYLLFDQEVDRENYDRIIDTLMSDMAPVMQRYARLFKEEHGLDQVSLADIKAPFTVTPPAKISIEESREILEKALGILGEDYLNVVKQSFDERWIDFPMNKTKSTGGFCASPYGKASYILLNWTGYLSEVLVLAHELGHAAHFYLGAKENPILTLDPSLYFVEAPSTCNEVITCQYLLNQPLENDAKRSLISEFISRTYYHNMVTHLLEAAFQRKVYQAVDNEEVLNAQVLNQFFSEVLHDFWGEALVINPGAELTWMRQPHYFMGLYSYTYSAGLSIGTQIGQSISQGDTQAIADWNKVIRLGGSLSPIELAAVAGVDMTTNEPVKAAVAYVSSLLDQLEELK